MSINHKLYLRSEFLSELGSHAYIDWFKELVMFPYANDLMFTFTSKDPGKPSQSSRKNGTALKPKYLMKIRSTNPKILPIS